MKKTLLSLLILFLIVEAKAQYPKLIVQFKDKGSNTFSLANPSQYLSSKAIQRRTRFNIAIDSTDLPVTQRYVDSLRLAGNVIILNRSKWLNQVLIQSTDATALAKIRNMAFVQSVNGVGFRVANNTTSRDKFKETIEPLAPANNNIHQRTAADFYNYGNSAGQVKIHEGEFLHNKGYRGQNIQIAVLDAGFQQYRTVTAFDSIRLQGQVLGERDFVAFDNSVNEDDSHGMYCLSIMSANWPGRMVGTAPKASYWLVRTENAPQEYPIEEFNWVAGAEFADSTGSDMISSSLGYYDFDDPSFNHTYNDFYKNRTSVTKGATFAAKKGLIVMNSAGNAGNNSWKYIGFPADADSVCAVGAVNASGQIASFSSYGYPGKVKPNIVSVGAGTIIAGFNNQPASGNGTSFSNPNVAGLIACLWQAFPTYNNMKILDAVYKSSDRYAAPTDRFGFGIPNFRKAYLSLKKEQNISLYGNDWLFATPNPFSTQIDVRLIGQVNGNARIDLVNSAGQVVATKALLTEIEEVYTNLFDNLGALPGGSYFVKYTDSLKTRSIELQKGTSIA
ncbi:MAG TPA: S8 family serine peptidase, partial [Segetibacter sp.]